GRELLLDQRGDRRAGLQLVGRRKQVALERARGPRGAQILRWAPVGRGHVAAAQVELLDERDDLLARAPLGNRELDGLRDRGRGRERVDRRAVGHVLAQRDVPGAQLAALARQPRADAEEERRGDDAL